MESENNKKLQLFVRRASGVSRALWPAEARRRIATGKAAQRRRSLIIRGKWWPGKGVQVRKRTEKPRNHLTFGVSIILVGSLFAAIRVFHYWNLVVLLAAMLAILLVFLVIVRESIYILQNYSILSGQSHFISAARRYIVEFLIYARMARLGRSRSAAHLIGSAFLRAPETPRFAEPPLIRVLETFDLSHTNVEHFVDPTLGGDTAELPVDWSEDTAHLTHTI